MAEPAKKIETPAMSPQQRRFSAAEGRLATYKEFLVGEESYLSFAGFELYNLLLSNIPSIVGLGLRSLALPFLFKGCGKGLVLGRGVVIRQPKNISVGRGVIVEDYAALDVRSGKTPDKKAVAQQAGIEIGDHVFIGRHSILAAKGGKIKLGAACNLSSYCRIATQSSVEIGESVLIAAYAYIGPGNHSTDDGRPMIEQEMDVKGGVKIGAHSWIGTRATILDGVTIGKNVIVGAHSLVLEDVPDNAVVAGTPARVLKIRD